MKFFSSIIIVLIVYANIEYALTSPINLANVLNENAHVNKKDLTSNDLPPSGKYNPEHMGGHYQGDMIIPKQALRGAASRPPWQRWPNGVIPYIIRPSISATHAQLITSAMRQMEDLTQVDGVPCIHFRPKNDNDDIFITIQNGSGCSAYVGYLEPYVLDRIVTLMYAPPYTCMVTGIIQHELLHVLGFYHEQSRPDRDDYVSIQWGNIIAGTENNFAKYGEVDIDTLKTSYDYGSVMHYESDAFTVNGLRTIVPTKDPNAVIGQRVGMSPIDILEVQRYYGAVPIPP